MAIAFRSSTTGGDVAAANVTCAAPAGLANNDILVMCVYHENTNAITWPAGFTEWANQNYNAGAAPVSNVAIAWKRAASESGSYQASWTGSVFNDAALLAYSGCVTSGDPADVAATKNASSATEAQVCTFPAITTTTDNDMLLAFGSYELSSGSFWVKTAAWDNLRINFDDIGIQDKALAAHGTQVSATMGTSGSACFTAAITIALKPAAAAGSTKAGSGVAPAVASGARDKKLANSFGSTVSPHVASGARDKALANSFGSAATPHVASGVDQFVTSDLGSGTAPAVASGVDQFIPSENGGGVSPAVASGVDQFVPSESGSGRAPAVASGVDQFITSDQGSGVAPAVASGVDQFAPTELGSGTAPAVASGASVRIAAGAGKAGSAVAPATASGADVFIDVDQGSGVVTAVASGASQIIHTGTPQGGGMGSWVPFYGLYNGEPDSRVKVTHGEPIGLPAHEQFRLAVLAGQERERQKQTADEDALIELLAI